MRLLKRLNPTVAAWCATLAFLCAYTAISVFNHYVFRTFAYDLGIKNQVIWDYAHFRANYNTVLPELKGEVNVLANHFEPVLFLFGPLYYIFGSYTLLVVQIVFVLLGGWGVYLFTRLLTPNSWFAVAAMAAFYSMWGVFSALSYDFHTNVLAAMAVPWLFYFMQKGRFAAAFLVLFFMLNCKENMALWSVFLGLGIAVHYRNNRQRRNVALLLSGVSAVYFLLVMQVFMPWFSEGKLTYMHFKYHALGDDMGEALVTMITRPVYAFRLLFEVPQTTGDLFFDRSKMQLHTFVFLSGGIFLLLRPAFLLMLLPVYAQKMFSDDPEKWGIVGQYSIEFAPVMVLAGVVAIVSLRDHRAQLLAGVLFFLTVLDTAKEVTTIWKPLPYGKELANFYQPSHYRRLITVKGFSEKLRASIPENAPVSASFYLVPHLAARSRIYLFPEIKDAEYVVLADDEEAYYPLEAKQFYERKDSLMQSGAWETVQDSDGLTVLRKLN